MISLAHSHTLSKSIVFVGMMGSGKTAIGRAVATRIGVPFGDTDMEVETRERMTIVSLFSEKGEAYFRDCETRALRTLLSGPVRAVSLGGGGFLSDRNRGLLRNRAVSVWLKADLDLLWSRVRHKGKRPLLKTEDPYGTLAALLEQRTPIYAQADIHVSADKRFSKDDMADNVVSELLKYSETNELLTGKSCR